MSPRSIILIACAAIGLILILVGCPFVTVPAGSTGVVKTFGAISGKTFDQGLHTRIPFVQSVENVNNKIQTIEWSGDSQLNAASIDMQTVSVSLLVRYHLSPGASAAMLRDVGPHYDERLIIPIVVNAVKAATGQHRVADMIRKRAEIRRAASEMVRIELEKNNINFDGLDILNFDWSDEYEKAIQNKQIAEQEAQQAQYGLQKARVDKERLIVEAQAKAREQELQKTTITDNLLRMRALENQTEWIRKWNGQLPATMLGNNASVLLGQSAK